MTVYNFQFASQNNIIEESPDGSSIVIDSLVMHEDVFTDRKGLVLNADRDVLLALEKGYSQYLMGSIPNKVVAAVKGLFNKTITTDYQNVFLDHEDSARNIVGKLISIETREHNGQLFAFAKLNILKKENVEMVKLGLWNRVSIGFNYKQKDKIAYINEISFVGNAAVSGGLTFSAAKKPNEDSELVFSLQKSVKDSTDELYNYKMQSSMIKGEKYFNYNLSKMVKDGKISQATSKLLKYDLSHVPIESASHVQRALDTIVLGKTQKLGSSVDWRSALAVDNFFNNFPEGSKKMQKNISDITTAFKKATDEIQISLGKKKEVSMGKEEDKEVKKEDKKESGDKDATMSRENVKRMHSMHKEGKHEELSKAFSEYLGEEDNAEMGACMDGDSVKTEASAAKVEPNYDERIKACEDKMSTSMSELASNVTAQLEAFTRKITGLSHTSN